MSQSVAELCSGALAAGLAPEPVLSVSAWADTYRLLSSVASSEPGQWRTSRRPYLREIMDCLSPSHPAQRVVIMAGAQIGKTECGNNWIGYVIHHAPGPMLMVQPTVDVAKRVSKQRLAPMIDGTPALRARVAPARSRDSGNTVQVKEFEGGVLIITGANSGAGTSYGIAALADFISERYLAIYATGFRYRRSELRDNNGHERPADEIADEVVGFLEGR